MFMPTKEYFSFRKIQDDINIPLICIEIHPGVLKMEKDNLVCINALFDFLEDNGLSVEIKKKKE